MNKFKRICILTLSLMFIFYTIAFGDEEVEYNRKEYDRMSEEIIEEQNKAISYNSDIEKCLEEIKTNEDKIKEIQTEIQKISDSISVLESDILEIKTSMDKRVRESYKENIYLNLASYILSSNVNDLLDKIDGVVMVLRNDNKMVEEIKRKEEELNKSKNDLLYLKSVEDKANDDAIRNKERLEELLKSQNELVEALKVKQEEFDEKYLAVSERELIAWHISVINDSNSTAMQLYEVSQQLTSLRDYQMKSPIIIEEINSLLDKCSEKIKDISGSDTLGGVIVNYAMGYIGVPYVWGGTTPDGWDCSGFTSYIYRNAIGVEITRTTYTQRYEGVSVSYDELQLGDLVFTNGYSHVGIYVGGGNYINAPQPGDVTRITPIYNFNEGRRIVN